MAAGTQIASGGCALVLEGGGYRGVFTAGVLDVLMENGVYGFQSVWGTSAGALNATGFKSHQPGRTIRVMLAFRDDPRMMSFRSLARTGNFTGGDFLYHEVQDSLDPCDVRTFNQNPLPMYCVATDVVFGAPAYLQVKCLPDDVQRIQASASLPLVSRMVQLDGHRYLDGGTTDSVPVEVALGLRDGAPEGYQPASRALVVLTQHRSYVKDGATERLAVRSHRYDEYPYYLEALRTRAQRYNRQRQHIWDLEGQGRALVFAPSKPVEVSTAEREGGPLLALYIDGRQQAQARLDEIRRFVRQGSDQTGRPAPDRPRG
ncbi:MAG: patatin family protein [Coriobacteriales bacterium]|nr:patatin family protein [Coriobacteriales bacterium]